MIFEDSYITDAGQALITRATAGTKIIWGKCGCYEHTGINAMSDSQINALTTLNNPCALGQASSVFEDYGAENYDAKITSQVSNAETGCSAGQALAFGLWGKIEGDASEVLVAVARSGTHTPTTFPDYDGTIQTRLIGVVELTIKVQRGAASTITVNPSLFALANDLQTEIEAMQNLQDRVVTTHKADDLYSGEDQEIYGSKTFMEEMHPKSGLSWPEILLTGGYAVSAKASRFDISGGFSAAGIRVFSLSESDTGKGCSMSCVFDTEVEEYTLTCDSDRIEIKSEVVPYCVSGTTFSNFNLGASDHRWTCLYSSSVDVLSLVSSNVAATTISSSNCYIDTQLSVTGDTDVDTIRATGIFDAAGGIKGLLGETSSGTLKPGCLILAYIPANTFSTAYSALSSHSVEANKVKYAKIIGSSISGGSYIPAGTYAFLNEYTYNQDSVVLLMKMEQL